MGERTKRSQRLQLPASLDHFDADELLQKIVKKRGASLTINAANVTKTSVLCLQVLLSARSTWAHDQNELKISNPSSHFLEDLQHLGLSVDHFKVGANAQ